VFFAINSKEQEQVDSVMEKCIKLHRTLVAPLVLNLAINWIQHGELIIRPMWYSVERPAYPKLDPTEDNPTGDDSTEDAGIFGVFDQFMLGPDVIVTPLVNLNNPFRFVSLPEGKWRQMAPIVKIHNGACMVHIGDVPLTGPPVYFMRVKEN